MTPPPNLVAGRMNAALPVGSKREFSVPALGGGGYGATSFMCHPRSEVFFDGACCVSERARLYNCPRVAAR